MPPKAKESKPAAADPDAAAAEQKALMESELIMAALRSRLTTYQAAGEKLAVENFSLSDELAKQKLTLQDINEFLTNELKARSLAAAQLEERVSQLSTRLAEVQKESQAEITRIKAEAAAEVTAAAHRAAAAAATAAGDAAAGQGSTGDVAGQKAQLERAVAELTATLSAQQKDFDARLSDMERRNLQDKEKMRKEHAAKIRETKMAMAQLADKHLESSTKRTLVENETMVAELAYHTAQSHDLVAANGMLRSEAAELRRQLAISRKTVQSTAHKNLLLQQTIKSILTCLREEACHNAAAAAAEQQQCSFTGQPGSFDTQAGHSAGAELHYTLHVPSHLQPHEQQQQQQQQDADGEAGNAGLQQQQQQQGTGDGVDAVVQHLEAQVVCLTDELAAAKQALAAALQGCLPQGLGAACTASSSSSRTAAGTGVGTGGQVQQQAQPACCCDHSCAAACSSDRKGAASPTQARSRSPTASTRRQRQRQQQQQGDAGGGGKCCCCGGSSQPSAMEVALEDGVAAFVLFCVQQLRRGGASSSSSSLQQAATQSAGDAGTVGDTSAGRQVGSPSSRRDRAPAAAAAGSPGTPGGSKRAAGTAAPAAVSDDRLVSKAANLSTSAAAAAGGGEGYREGGGGGGDDAAGSAAAEQLARLLLDQLHSYSRHNLVPYSGISLIFPGDEQQQLGLEAAVHGVHGGGSAEAEMLQWPAGPLPGAAAGSNAAHGGSTAPAAQALEECNAPASISLQLPPLPCLLNMAQRSNKGERSPGALQQQQHQQQQQQQQHQPSSPGGGAGASSSAAASGFGKLGRNRSPVRGQERDGLFSAVLSELRPWGPTGGAAGIGSSSGTGIAVGDDRPQAGTAAAGSLASAEADRKALGAAAAAAGGVLGRSRTPTSPAGIKTSFASKGGSPLSSPSSKVRAARH